MILIGNSHAAPVAQSDRVAGFEPVGWVFDSPQARHSASLFNSSVEVGLRRNKYCSCRNNKKGLQGKRSFSPVGIDRLQRKGNSVSFA